MFATKGTVQYYYSLLVVLRQFIIIIADNAGSLLTQPRLTNGIYDALAMNAI